MYHIDRNGSLEPYRIDNEGWLFHTPFIRHYQMLKISTLTAVFPTLLRIMSKIINKQ